MTDEELRTTLREMEERIDEKRALRAEAMEERLLARIEKSETNLLRAFHSWARDGGPPAPRHLHHCYLR